MFNKKYIQEIDYLNKKIEQLNIENGRYVAELLQRKEELNNISTNFESVKAELADLKKTLDCDSTILSKLSEIKELEDSILDLKQRQHIQTLGFFDLQKDVRYYRDELSQCRLSQKRILIDKTYYSSKESWYINNNARDGNKLLEFLTSIAVTSFNLSCDSWFDNITIANAEYIKVKVTKIWNNYNLELNKHKVELNGEYLELKLREIDIRLNIYIKQQQDKEEERRQKEIIREQAKAELELTKNKEKLEKELIHYQLQANKGEDVADKIKEIEARIETDDFMLTKTRAGYCYFIVNKSFNDDEIVKIGVSKRLNPFDRIKELSDASVPFRYYDLAIVFTEDAYDLETRLHRRLSEYRVNKLNKRKEQFKIDRDELLKILNDEFHLNVEFKEPVDEEWLFSIDNGLNM